MHSTLTTYLYPGAEKYIHNFINSLNEIDLSDMDICIFNDGGRIPRGAFESLKFPVEIINIKGTINEIRYNSFEILKSIGSDHIIFQDIDDLFSANRFSILNEKLLSYDLVCNDLKEMTDNKIEEESFWKKRLGNNFEFDSNFIKDKNIVGLGNTAIKKCLLNTETFFSDKPLAFDWFYFYQLLRLNNIKALFTSEAHTHYLQHDNNVAGIRKNINKERLEHIFTVKKMHYLSLISHGFKELEPYFNKLSKHNITFKHQNKNYLWWEELN